MNNIHDLRDIVYFDFPKAASIWSQVDNGLVDTITSSYESESSERGVAGGGLPKLLEIKGSLEDKSKSGTVASRLLHHNLLNYLERVLSEEDLLADVSEEQSPGQLAHTHPYIRATGKLVIEDYKYLSDILDNFTELAFFSFNAQYLSSMPDDLSQHFDAINKEVIKLKSETDIVSSSKSRTVIYNNIVSVLKKTGHYEVPDWFFHGINTWINVYVNNKVISKLKSASGKEAVVAELKREYFFDDNIDHILFSYGHETTIDLTLIGLVTSIPTQDSEHEDQGVNKTGKDQGSGVMAEAFENIFSSLRSLADHMNPMRYPNIGVYPIAIYRKLS